MASPTPDLSPRNVPLLQHSGAGQLSGRADVLSLFPYPGNGHCGGGTGPQINGDALFSTLVNWVENGVAPDFVVGSQNLGGGATRTRKVCMYPNVPVYNGSGSTDDQANFICQVKTRTR